MKIDIGKVIAVAKQTGLLDKLLEWVLNRFSREHNLPKNLPAAHPDPLDEDIPDPGPRPGPGEVAKVLLGESGKNPILRVVLSAKRFPEEDANGTLSYIPNLGDAIPFQSKVTFEVGLADAAGKGIQWGKGDKLAHTTAFYLAGPTQGLAQVGPGSGGAMIQKGTFDIGPGGANYEASQGAVATFKVVSEGQYTFYAENSGVRSENFSFNVS